MVDLEKLVAELRADHYPGEGGCQMLKGYSQLRHERYQAADALSAKDAEITSLRAEVERMREALGRIAETPNAGWMIARAALGGTAHD